MSVAPLKPELPNSTIDLSKLPRNLPDSDSGYGKYKVNDVPLLKGEGFFSKMWSAIKMGVSAAVGIPLAFAASMVIIPMMALSKGLDILHTHVRKTPHSTPTLYHNKTLEAFHNFTSGIFQKVWGWALSPYTQPAAAVISKPLHFYEQSRVVQYDLSQHPDARIAMNNHRRGEPNPNDVHDPEAEPLLGAEHENDRNNNGGILL